MATVRVRIAVAVNEEGEWAASMFCDDDKDAAQLARDNVSDHCLVAVHFIEADVPLPESQTIQGEVKP